VATGSSGCNDFHGRYTIDGQEIVFGTLASTVKVCGDAAMIVESNFVQAMSYVARFGVRDTGLLFVSPPGAALLAFAPKPTGSVEGDWTVSAMQNAQGAIVPPIDGTPLTTSFKADGTLTGNDGCNDFSGSYTLSGPRIVISGLSGTRAACPSPDLSDQETQFLTMLQASTIWTASDAEIAFRGTNGIQTLTYVPAGS
jgi:heat shock protein HslJ